MALKTQDEITAINAATDLLWNGMGSGVIEAGCKTVIERWLNQSGMFWGKAGAENILQLRCLLKSPHFEATWQARRPLLAARQVKARRWSKVS